MKHNKKRNVGIVYELLLSYISKNLLEGKKSEAKKATRIIEKRFKKGTELYKEFRLFNALANTKITNTHTVASILTEAKNAARNLINEEKLQREKSDLIRDINYNLGKDFYYSSIANYRDLGTVHLAIKEWRKKSPDIKNLISFETQIAENMLKKEENVLIKENLDASHSDRLVLKLMTEKFNKQYCEELTHDQKKIVENYVFYNNKNQKKLTDFFTFKKKESIKNLEKFEDISDNKYLLSKINEVKNKIDSLDENKINDNSVVKFLTLTKMIDEIKKEF
jgi:hypothetical protein